MDTRPIVYPFSGLILIATFVRLQFSFPEDPPEHGPKSSWIYVSWFSRLVVRHTSFILAVWILCLSTIASHTESLDILVYATISCVTTVEIFQAYTAVRRCPVAEYWKIAEVIAFVVIFVLPKSLCFSLILPISNGYEFISFALPVGVDLFGQAVANWKIWKRATVDLAVGNLKEREIGVRVCRRCLFNIRRTGCLTALFIILAGGTFTARITVRQQQTLYAAFLVVTSSIPAAFIKPSQTTCVPSTGKLGCGQAKSLYFEQAGEKATVELEHTGTAPGSILIRSTSNYREASHQLPPEFDLQNDNDDSDHDSGSCGRLLSVSSTRSVSSLRSSDYDFPSQNGRQSHLYERGKHFAPNESTIRSTSPTLEECEKFLRTTRSLPDAYEAILYLVRELRTQSSSSSGSSSSSTQALIERLPKLVYDTRLNCRQSMQVLEHNQSVIPRMQPALQPSQAFVRTLLDRKAEIKILCDVLLAVWERLILVKTRTRDCIEQELDCCLTLLMSIHGSELLERVKWTFEYLVTFSDQLRNCVYKSEVVPVHWQIADHFFSMKRNVTTTANYDTNIVSFAILTEVTCPLRSQQKDLSGHQDIHHVPKL